MTHRLRTTRLPGQLNLDILSFFLKLDTLSYQTQESISQGLPLGKPGAIFPLMNSVRVSFFCQLDTNLVTRKQGTSTEELSRSDWPVKPESLDSVVEQTSRDKPVSSVAVSSVFSTLSSALSPCHVVP